MRADGVLVVGYGNGLRGDDGVGCHVAGLLAEDARLAGARVLARHQLTPELAEDVSDARLVVLVDARVGGVAPGDVHVHTLEPGQLPAPAGSHALAPGDLAAVSYLLYGRVPPVLVVSVAGERFELGQDLSPAVAAAVPQVVDAVVGLVDAELPLAADS